MDIATIEPTTATAGDTWQWTKELDDWPASIYGLEYCFRTGVSASVIVAATVSGGVFNISIPPATTSNFPAGELYWAAYATLGSDRWTVGTGRIQVRANFETGTPDPRSIVKQTLDAINSCILGTASADDQRLEVDGMLLIRRTSQELITLQIRYQMLYDREVRLDNIANGRGNSRKILSQFV